MRSAPGSSSLKTKKNMDKNRILMTALYRTVMLLMTVFMAVPILYWVATFGLSPELAEPWEKWAFIGYTLVVYPSVMWSYRSLLRWMLLR